MIVRGSCAHMMRDDDDDGMQFYYKNMFEEKNENSIQLKLKRATQRIPI